MRNHRKSYYTRLLKGFFIVIICPFFSISQSKPLQIGDTLPAAAWQSLSPVPLVEGVSASGGRGRFVILDFFATWCTSCYKRFPHLDSLQQELGDSVTIILVNTVSAREDSARVANFFEKRKKPNGLPYRFRLIIGDSVLNKLFPHVLIPHYVWIYNNRFIAATSSEWVTRSNIRAVLSGIPVKWEIKTDSLQFEKRKSLINK